MKTKDRLKSIWEKYDLPRYPTIDSDIKTKVCVVGGGIAGISCAYQLAKAGHEVTIVEAFSIASGQTGRTTAHLTTQLEDQFIDLVKMHDDVVIKTFHDAHAEAINTIERIVESEMISCGFHRLSGYLFAGKNFTASDLETELTTANRLGAGLEAVGQVPWLKKKIPGLKFSNQGQFNPIQYIRGLLQVMSELNVRVVEETQVTSLTNRDPRVTVLETDKGYKIEANFVIVATDTPISTRFSIHTKQHAYRTYAVEFDITNPAMAENELLLWDTEDPYHYIRLIDGHLVVGGCDHKTGQEPEEDPFERLITWARDHFEFIGDVVSKWSGQVFEPSDSLPYIGKSPGMEDNVFLVTGASGIGMTTATIASVMIRDFIEGKDHPWASTFGPSRLAHHGWSEYIKENVNVALQYGDWLKGSEVSNIQDIPEDSGAVMREGVGKTCIYHLEGDHFEKKSAVCTHLGGIVHWNDIEKTWDCPCHGSRFNVRGKPIEGPARMNLSEK
jgi:glycine/D-amino acid oxidase-like deaminating enzyme/nitrite reductase/ring-hydroxylating ferredoxin subunit